MAIGVFGSKTFTVSGNRIYTLSNMSLGKALSIENIDVAGNKPSTYIKGIGLDSFSCDIILDSRYVDVQKEIDDWSATLTAKKAYAFSLGKSFLGKNKWLLKSMDISNTVMDGSGMLLKAVIALKFEEYVREGKPSTSSSSGTSGSTSAGLVPTALVTTVNNAGTGAGRSSVLNNSGQSTVRTVTTSTGSTVTKGGAGRSFADKAEKKRFNPEAKAALNSGLI